MATPSEALQGGAWGGVVELVERDSTGGQASDQKHCILIVKNLPGTEIVGSGSSIHVSSAPLPANIYLSHLAFEEGEDQESIFSTHHMLLLPTHDCKCFPIITTTSATVNTTTPASTSNVYTEN